MSKLREERLKRGLTQFDVARLTGIHPATIAHIESGDIRAWPKYQRAFEELFGIPREELFAERKAESGGPKA